MVFLKYLFEIFIFKKSEDDKQYAKLSSKQTARHLRHDVMLLEVAYHTTSRILVNVIYGVDLSRSPLDDHSARVIAYVLSK